MKTNKKIMYSATVCAIAIIGAAFVFMNPYSATERTLKTAEVSRIALFQAEDYQVCFIVSVPVSNPSNIPVTITEINIRMLVNGIDHSRTLDARERVVLYPGKTFTVQKMVKLWGSPIGFQSQEISRYTLQMEVEIHGEAKSLGMSSSNSYSFTDTRTWTYYIPSLFDPLD